MPLRINYASTGDTQTAAEMDATNAQVNANTTDVANLVLNTISKTVAYPAVAGDMVVCDATGGAFTVTLPTSPPNKTRVTVFKVDATANDITIAAGGSNKFNITTGPTTWAVSGQFSMVQVMYNSANGVWYTLNKGLVVTPASIGLGNVDNTSDATKWAATKTLTNTRIVTRQSGTPSSATPTIDTDALDAYDITALAVNITSMSSGLSGTPGNFQPLMIRIKDNGSARTIAWGSLWYPAGVALPTTTVAGKEMLLGAQYNTTRAKWGLIASNQEA